MSSVWPSRPGALAVLLATACGASSPPARTADSPATGAAWFAETLPRFGEPDAIARENPMGRFFRWVPQYAYKDASRRVLLNPGPGELRERDIGLFVVDVQAVLGSAACASCPNECRIVQQAINNCVAYDTVVVCDLRFAWLLVATARASADANAELPLTPSFRALSAAGRAVLSRYERLQASGASWSEWKKELATIPDYVSPWSDDVDLMTLNAFQAFVFRHELAHIELGHTAAGNLVPCASMPLDARARRSAQCPMLDGGPSQLMLSLEKAADAEAVAHVREDLPADSNGVSLSSFSWQILWILLADSVSSAIVQAGGSPARWSYERAPEEQRAKYQYHLARGLCAGSHPSLVGRLDALFQAWHERGLPSPLDRGDESLREQWATLQEIVDWCPRWISGTASPPRTLLDRVGRAWAAVR